MCYLIYVSLYESIENWIKFKFFFRDFFILYILIICSVGMLEKGFLSLEFLVNGVLGYFFMLEGEIIIVMLVRVIIRLYIKDSVILYLILSWLLNR